MKKNKKTYLLLIMVLSIWGILGFRIVRTINPDTGEIPFTEKMERFSPPTKKLSDTFSIVANYRDPFLGTLPKTASPKKPVSVKAPKEREVNISYTGYVKENSTGSKIFFVTIDGDQHMMSRNDSFKEVKLLSGTSEMIKVRVAGKNKSIPLAK